MVSLNMCKEVIKCGDVRNTSLTPDKEMNILLHGTISAISDTRVITFLKMASFLAHLILVVGAAATTTALLKTITTFCVVRTLLEN